MMIKNIYKTPGRRRISLRIGISAAFVLMVLFTAVIICSVLFVQMRNIMRQDIRSRIGDIAGLAALLIPEELHRQVKSTEDEKYQPYLILKRNMQLVKKISPDVRFAYTIKKDTSGKLYFWIDAETDPTVGSRVGDLIKEPTTLMFEAFKNPDTKMVEPEFYNDSWGTWLSAYSPVYAADGRLECIVGVDISASKIAETEFKAIMLLIFVALLITIPVAFLGLLLSKRIVRPLSILENDMRKTRELQIDHDLAMESRFIEIIDMRNTLNAMKSGLRSFSKYVPTDIVRELIIDGNDAVLGSRKAELTVFFSDIEGFTTLAESSTPEDLAEDLSEYFAIITAAILESGGTVDKYIGDAVMAFWGAPVPFEDHARRAIKTSMSLLYKLKELNAKRISNGRPPIKTRMGIATGDVVVGNFGYDSRLNYTVMGDTVNLSSRLEGLNKYMGTTILTNEACVNQAGSAVLSRMMGVVAVKGKHEGVRIYQPVRYSVADNLTDLKVSVTKWNDAMNRYMNRDFNGSIKAFELWLSEYKNDRPAQLMINNCRQYILNPPGKDWDGSIIMETK